MTFTPAALPPKGVKANLEHPDTTAQTLDYITQSLCLVFMTVFFGLRMYVKLFILNGFGIEDCESLVYSLVFIIVERMFLVNIVILGTCLSAYVRSYPSKNKDDANEYKFRYWQWDIQL
jgi:hypothetical protein